MVLYYCKSMCEVKAGGSIEGIISQEQLREISNVLSL